MLNDANLFNTELFARLEMICSVMNCHPIKKITPIDHILTLSPKELVHPFLSRVHVRQVFTLHWYTTFGYCLVG